MYGKVTGANIGLVMREGVRRATVAIRAQRFLFEATGKVGYGGKNDDFVTTADRAAQAAYLKLLRKNFPTYGIIAEEDNLRVPSTEPDGEFLFAVDPLDGTKAFMRGQSEGVGTMISLIGGLQIIAGYVGDIMTGEIYGYRPGSAHTYQIHQESGVARQLGIDATRPLREQYLLLREIPQKYPPVLRDRLVEAPAGRKIFHSFNVIGGSIGIGMARLWKGEIGGVLLAPAAETPWDSCPVIGISTMLGFRFLQWDEEGVCFTPQPSNALAVLAVSRREYPLLVVHESRIPELRRKGLLRA